jgi:hypothetical protein
MGTGIEVPMVDAWPRSIRICCSVENSNLVGEEASHELMPKATAFIFATSSDVMP